jgi:hypothetical protein
MKRKLRKLLIQALVLIFFSGSLLVVFSAIRGDVVQFRRMQQLNYGKPVIVTVAWNNSIYEVTDNVLTSVEIGSLIGSVVRQVSPRPVKNGDLARNTAEGPGLMTAGQENLFAIKNADRATQIALERSAGQFFQCVYFCQLP